MRPLGWWVAAGVLVTVACSGSNGSSVAEPRATTTTAVALAAETCPLLEDAAFARHQADIVAVRSFEQQEAANEEWRAALGKLRDSVTAPGLRRSIDRLVAARTTASDHGWTAAENRAMDVLDAASDRTCGFGVSDLRLEPFAGLDVPRADEGEAPPFVVVSDGSKVEALDSTDGRSLGLIAEPIGPGLIANVEVSADRRSVYFLEELGAFAHPTWTVIWRVPVAGGPFELAAAARGLIRTFTLSDDGWIAYDDVTYHEQGSSSDPTFTIVEDGGDTRRAATPVGPWLAGHRVIATMDSGGRHGIGIVDVEDVDALTGGDPQAFHPAPAGFVWDPIAVRASDGAVLVTEVCCTPDLMSTSRQFLFDPASGRELADVTPGGDRFIVDFDRSGRHALVVGDTVTDCDHVCSSTLYRQDGSNLRRLRDGVVGAAW